MRKPIYLLCFILVSVIVLHSCIISDGYTRKLYEKEELKADIINTVGEIDNKTEEYSKTKDENLFWQDVTDADIKMEMNEELDNLVSITGTYCTTNDHEYFAEAFQAYYTKNDRLLEYCPKTYEVVEEAINKVITREHRENTSMYY